MSMGGSGERPGDRLPADHPEPHREPVGGPGAWFGPDLVGAHNWAYVLSEAERGEFTAAMRHALARHDDIARIAKGDFPLPCLGHRLDELRREVVHGRGFALLRNFPVEGLAFKEIACMYWGLGLHLGSARSQNVRGHMLGHVVDITDTYTDPNNRGYLTARHLKYHSDSADMVALLCLHRAMEGGLSSIVSSYTIHDEMWRRRPDLAEILYGPVARGRRNEIPEGKGPWYELPVFNYCQGRLAVSFLRQFIDDSQDIESAPRHSKALVEALDMLEELANDPALYLSMDFRPGDIQLLHNHQILHNRTAYTDWPEAERKRYLLRLWLSPRDGIALPDAFAERYGGTAVGDRGGVVVPGTTLQVPLKAV